MLDGIHSIGPSIPHSSVSTERAGTPETSAPVQAEEPHKAPASSAIYYSPAVQIDHEANMAIFVVRNSETGAVINQFPSKRVVEEYKRADTQRVEEIRTHSKATISTEAPEVKKVEVKQVPTPVVEAKPVVVEDKPVAPTVKETV